MNVRVILPAVSAAPPKMALFHTVPLATASHGKKSPCQVNKSLSPPTCWPITKPTTLRRERPCCRWQTIHHIFRNCRDPSDTPTTPTREAWRAVGVLRGVRAKETGKVFRIIPWPVIVASKLQRLPDNSSSRPWMADNLAETSFTWAVDRI